MTLSELCAKFKDDLAEFMRVTEARPRPWKEIGNRAHDLCGLAQQMHLEASHRRGAHDPIVGQAIDLITEYYGVVESLTPIADATDPSAAEKLNKICEICKDNSRARIELMNEMREARQAWRESLETVA